MVSRWRGCSIDINRLQVGRYHQGSDGHKAKVAPLAPLGVHGIPTPPGAHSGHCHMAQPLAQRGPCMAADELCR